MKKKLLKHWKKNTYSTQGKQHHFILQLLRILIILVLYIWKFISIELVHPTSLLVSYIITLSEIDCTINIEKAFENIPLVQFVHKNTCSHSHALFIWAIIQIHTLHTTRLQFSSFLALTDYFKVSKKVTEKWENAKNSEIVRKILQKDLSISTKRPL